MNNPETMTDILREWWHTFSGYLDNPFAKIVIIVVGLYLIHRIIRRIVGNIVRSVVRSHKHLSKRAEEQREETLEGIFRTASAVLLWIVGLILVLASLEVNIAALITGAGLIGVIVSLGAQSAIKDFLAGIFIIAENQYRVGDIVTLAGVSGMVESISIRITRLRDLDGNMHIIPNGEAKYVTNMTYMYSNVNMDIGVAYSSDLEKVKKVINEVGKEMTEDKTWGVDILEPIEFFRVDSFGESAVKIKALGKVVPSRQWDVAGEFRRRIKIAFEKEGITIPFPQRVIHTKK